MANRYATKTGNWSDATVWDGGTTLPGSGDTVRPNNFIVTIDQDISVVALTTNASSPAAAGGQFVVSSIASTRSITLSATLMAKTTTPTLSLTASSGVLTLTAPITGGAAANQTTVTISGVLTVNIVGSLIGGIYNTSFAMDVTAAAVLNITGDVTGASDAGNSGSALHVTSAAVITITGTVNGGPGTSTNTHGIIVTAGATFTVNGNVVGGAYTNDSAIVVSGATIITVTGTVTGGQAAGTFGIEITGTGSNITVGSAVATVVPAINSTAACTIVVTGAVTASVSSMAINTGTVASCTISAGGPLTHASNNVVPIFSLAWAAIEGQNVTYTVRGSTTAADVVLSKYVTDSPAPANVRDGATYGPSGDLTGTLKVPSPSSVANGVPTDNTTGTAALLMADMAAILGAQIAAATSA